MKFLKNWWNKVRRGDEKTGIDVSANTVAASKSPTITKKPRRVTRRMRDPRRHEWHRVFGGIACSDYVD